MHLHLLRIAAIALFATSLSHAADDGHQRLAYGYSPYWQPPPVHYTNFRRYPGYGNYGQPGWRTLPSQPKRLEKPAAAQNNEKPTESESSTRKKPAFSSVAAKKKAFFDQVVPLVHEANRKISNERKRMFSLLDVIEEGGLLNSEDQLWLKNLAKRYRVKKDPLTESQARAALRIKVDVIPVDLAVAQAANESAWGQSRFAREAKNLFGVWTFDKSRGLAPRARDEGHKHMIRKYDTLGQSIQHYLNLLNSHPAYVELRKIRTELRDGGDELDGFLLAEGLENYSSRGQEYVNIIQAMITGNNLERFRTVKIDAS